VEIFYAFLRERLLWWAVLAFSLSAGIVGAYGRERHEGRAPDADWWKNRFYIMPFLAITASYLTDQFALSNQQMAMAASLLSLLGYEALRMILERARKKADIAADTANEVLGGGKATPRPYHSVVDTDAEGRAVAHVEPTDQEHPRQGSMRSALRETYRTPKDLPDEQQNLLDRLGDIEV